MACFEAIFPDLRARPLITRIRYFTQSPPLILLRLREAHLYGAPLIYSLMTRMISLYRDREIHFDFPDR